MSNLKKVINLFEKFKIIIFEIEFYLNREIALLYLNMKIEI